MTYNTQIQKYNVKNTKGNYSVVKKQILCNKEHTSSNKGFKNNKNEKKQNVKHTFL